jgi:hypothetical protein
MQSKNLNLYLLLVIAALIIVILLMRSCTPTQNVDIPAPGTTKVDTTYRDIVKYETKTVVIYETDTEYVKEPWMIPDSNYAVLKQQFEDLVNLYAVKNIYKDTILVDTIGYITVTDTIQKNKMLQRKYFHLYSIPTITITNVVPLPPKRELFLGAGVSLAYPTVPQGISTGLLFKDKKNHVFGLQCGVNTKGLVTYNASMYWNIALKK